MKPINKLLKTIFKNYGFVNSVELKELAKELPTLQLCIKWGGLPREILPADQIAKRISDIETQDIDYCREVFIPSHVINSMLEWSALPKTLKNIIINNRAW
jgi:hypothetical protein